MQNPGWEQQRQFNGRDRKGGKMNEEQELNTFTALHVTGRSICTVTYMTNQH